MQPSLTAVGLGICENHFQVETFREILGSQITLLEVLILFIFHIVIEHVLVLELT